MIQLKVKEKTNYRSALNQAERLLRTVKNLNPVIKEWAVDYNALIQKNYDKDGMLFQDGGWPQLNRKYKEWKSRNYGVEKILLRTGALISAATKAKGSYKGGKVILTWILPDYWKYHQQLERKGTKIPQRAFIADEDGNIPKRAIIQLIRLLDKKITKTLPPGVL